jgi:hypothetical protein
VAIYIVRKKLCRLWTVNNLFTKHVLSTISEQFMTLDSIQSTYPLEAHPRRLCLKENHTIFRRSSKYSFGISHSRARDGPTYESRTLLRSGGRVGFSSRGMGG